MLNGTISLLPIFFLFHCFSLGPSIWSTDQPIIINQENNDSEDTMRYCNLGFSFGSETREKMIHLSFDQIAEILFLFFVHNTLVTRSANKHLMAPFWMCVQVTIRWFNFFLFGFETNHIHPTTFSLFSQRQKQNKQRNTVIASLCMCGAEHHRVEWFMF